MDQQKVAAFLQCFGSKITKIQGNGWIEGHCPLGPFRHQKGFDHHPSFGVETGEGDPSSHCFSCGWSGTLGDLILELRYLTRGQAGHGYDFATALKLVQSEEGEVVLSEESAYEKAMVAPVNTSIVFPEDWLDSFPKAYAANHVHPYLWKRAVPYWVAEHLDFRVDTFRNRVCVPIRDEQGVLRGFHGRTFVGEEPPYLAYTYKKMANPNVWLNENHLDRSRPVVFAESVFDLARTLEVYDNVVSPLSVGVNASRMKRMLGLVSIITLFDNDAAGNTARHKVGTFFSGDLVTHVLPPAEYGDAGKCPPAVLAELLAPFVPVTLKTTLH